MARVGGISDELRASGIRLDRLITRGNDVTRYYVDKSAFEAAHKVSLTEDEWHVAELAMYLARQNRVGTKRMGALAVEAVNAFREHGPSWLEHLSWLPASEA